MTTVLSVRLDAELAKRAEQASDGNLSSFVREAIEEKIKAMEKNKGNAVISHIKARAGTWDASVSGVALLKRTRP